MKDKSSIEQQLIAVRPLTAKTIDIFVEQTMVRVRKSHSANTQNSVAELPTQRLFNKLATRLNALPKFALVLLILLGALFVSGTAYAVYRLWIEPRVQTQTVEQNQYGRTQITAALEDCSTLGDQAIVEIKRGARLRTSETEAVLQAKCELGALQQWAHETYPTGQDSNTMVHAYEYIGLENGQIKAWNPNYARDDNREHTKQVTATDNTLVIVDGISADIHKLRTDAAIGIVEYLEYEPGGTGGHPIKREVKAIVQLSLPAQFYTYKKQAAISERKPCLNLPKETCVESGSIDVFPHNESDNTNHAVIAGTPRIVQGTLVSHTGASFVIKGSSGKEYVFTAPYDVLSTFNTEYGQNYQNEKIEQGDLIQVTFVTPPGGDSTTVRENQIMRIDLLIDVIDKNAPFKKY